MLTNVLLLSETCKVATNNMTNNILQHVSDNIYTIVFKSTAIKLTLGTKHKINNVQQSKCLAFKNTLLVT